MQNEDDSFEIEHEERFNFTILPDKLFDMPISNDAFKMFAVLCKYGFGKGKTWLNNKTLIAYLFPDLSERQSRRRLTEVKKELVNAGMIKMIPRFQNASQSSNLIVTLAQKSWGGTVKNFRGGTVKNCPGFYRYKKKKNTEEENTVVTSCDFNNLGRSVNFPGNSVAPLPLPGTGKTEIPLSLSSSEGGRGERFDKLGKGEGKFPVAPLLIRPSDEEREKRSPKSALNSSIVDKPSPVPKSECSGPPNTITFTGVVEGDYEADRGQIRAFKRKEKLRPESSIVWDCYSSGFRVVYGTEPARSAKTNSICSQLVKEYGLEASLRIVTWFLKRRDTFYTLGMHPLNLLKRDAHKLDIESKTGVKVTYNMAKEQERDEGNEQAISIAMENADNYQCPFERIFSRPTLKEPDNGNRISVKTINTGRAQIGSESGGDGASNNANRIHNWDD